MSNVTRYGGTGLPHRSSSKPAQVAVRSRGRTTTCHRPTFASPTLPLYLLLCFSVDSVITLYSYPELFGVADNNGYGLKVFAFLRLNGMPFKHEHVFDASAAPRGQLPYIVDDGEIRNKVGLQRRPGWKIARLNCAAAGIAQTVCRRRRRAKAREDHHKWRPSPAIRHRRWGREHLWHQTVRPSRPIGEEKGVGASGGLTYDRHVGGPRNWVACRIRGRVCRSCGYFLETSSSRNKEAASFYSRGNRTCFLASSLRERVTS